MDSEQLLENIMQDYQRIILLGQRPEVVFMNEHTALKLPDKRSVMGLIVCIDNSFKNEVFRIYVSWETGKDF